MTVAALAVMTYNVCAQTSGGGEALGFSRVIHDPVAAGKAFAGTASTSGMAWASFTNAAVIPLSDKKLDMATSYQGWSPQGAGSTNISAGAGLRLGKKSGLAIGFYNGKGEDYTLMDAGGNEMGTFTPKELQFNLGYGIRLAKIFSAGVNLKYLHTKLADDASYSTVAVDVLFMAEMAMFKVAAGVTDVGSSVKADDGTSFSLPSAFTVAGSYDVGLVGLEANLDASYYFKGGFTAALGAEYSFLKVMRVRAGYHYGSDKAVLPSFASAGLGVRLLGFSLDAAYLFGSDALQNTLTIGLGYSF